MSPEPVTSERIYQRLKADLLGGRYAPGTLLIIHALADEYGVSISPIRDSAQRLIGERLLDAHHGGGFMLPEATAEALRELYIWHGQLIRLALKTPTAMPDTTDLGNIGPLDAADPATIAKAAASLFAFIGRRSGNHEHAHAIVAAGERLSIARLAEPRLLSDVINELQMVLTLTVSGPEIALRDAIHSYHRRRIRRVSKLVMEMVGIAT